MHIYSYICDDERCKCEKLFISQSHICFDPNHSEHRQGIYSLKHEMIATKVRVPDKEIYVCAIQTYGWGIYHSLYEILALKEGTVHKTIVGDENGGR